MAGLKHKQQVPWSAVIPGIRWEILNTKINIRSISYRIVRINRSICFNLS